MRRRKERLDKLDAALDGRLVKVDEELAPLVETAAELRAALAGVELDPEAAQRHLRMVLDGEGAVVAVSTRPQLQANWWRRRVAAVALAAALTVLPATMASASALPGQALYPVKLAVEQLQVIAVSWSNTREADERIRIANNRLDELDRLIQLRAADRIPAAIGRLYQAYVDAQQAVDEVVRDTGNLSQMRALDAELAPVGATLQGLQDQGMLPTSEQQALTVAIGQPPVTSGLVTATPQPTPTTAGPVATTIVGSPTTTVPTTTTVPADVNDSPDQGGDGDSGQGGSGETATSLP